MVQLKEFNRQVEIAAIVYENPDKYSEYDLIQKFKISQSTIRRDFNELKKMGIDIRSRKRGVVLDISLKSLNSLLSAYIAVNIKNDIRNLNLIKITFRNKTISLFVNILKAINEKKYLEIQYVQSESDQPVNRIIVPIYLNSTTKTFLLVALEDNEIIFLRIEGIKSVSLTLKQFQGKTPDIHDIYRNSWGIYSGGKEIVAKLKFDRKWENYFEQRILIEDLDISYDEDSIILNFPVKLSYEFISWVMGWGKEVVIIGPSELKEAVLIRAKDLINNHKKIINVI